MLIDQVVLLASGLSVPVLGIRKYSKGNLSQYLSPLVFPGAALLACSFPSHRLGDASTETSANLISKFSSPCS